MAIAKATQVFLHNVCLNQIERWESVATSYGNVKYSTRLPYLTLPCQLALLSLRVATVGHSTIMKTSLPSSHLNKIVAPLFDHSPSSTTLPSRPNSMLYLMTLSTQPSKRHTKSSISRIHKSRRWMNLWDNYRKRRLLSEANLNNTAARTPLVAMLFPASLLLCPPTVLILYQVEPHIPPLSFPHKLVAPATPLPLPQPLAPVLPCTLLLDRFPPPRSIQGCQYNTPAYRPRLTPPTRRYPRCMFLESPHILSLKLLGLLTTTTTLSATSLSRLSQPTGSLPFLTQALSTRMRFVD